MTLRDYFAAKAMQTILADPQGVTTPLQIAQAAYGVAAAMLEARKK